ncbi:hypothetical protein EVAR_41962_1 [Eumeta japonica]|uniref:Uncharacterized protein n=1 Tax=Eumeta variegata TaxID=151549 RepID=A0A4C1WU37_EUMVA|nr:hypothetical protein EVAR_41962_1 [Eumeta japonica]
MLKHGPAMLRLGESNFLERIYRLVIKLRNLGPLSAAAVPIYIMGHVEDRWLFPLSTDILARRTGGGGENEGGRIEEGSVKEKSFGEGPIYKREVGRRRVLTNMFSAIPNLWLHKMAPRGNELPVGG